jgi:hypothetical protein
MAKILQFRKSPKAKPEPRIPSNRMGSWGRIEQTQEELLTRHDNGRTKDRVLAGNDYYPTIELTQAELLEKLNNATAYWAAVNGK